jgi:hypothetical protein
MTRKKTLFRLNRCRDCYKKFLEVGVTLKELKKSPGRVGLAVRDAINELSVFGEDS